MSPSAILALAAAASSAPAHDGQPARGVRVAEAQVTARILAPAIVRQATGADPAGDRAPRHQLSRRGNTVLIEFQ